MFSASGHPTSWCDLGRGKRTGQEDVSTGAKVWVGHVLEARGGGGGCFCQTLLATHCLFASPRCPAHHHPLLLQLPIWLLDRLRSVPNFYASGGVEFLELGSFGKHVRALSKLHLCILLCPVFCCQNCPPSNLQFQSCTSLSSVVQVLCLSLPCNGHGGRHHYEREPLTGGLPPFLVRPMLARVVVGVSLVACRCLALGTALPAKQLSCLNRQLTLRFSRQQRALGPLLWQSCALHVHV